MPGAASVKFQTIWLGLLHVTVLATESAHYACESTVFLFGKYSNTTGISEI